jgi:hypothetical protein
MVDKLHSASAFQKITFNNFSEKPYNRLNCLRKPNALMD